MDPSTTGTDRTEDYDDSKSSDDSLPKKVKPKKLSAKDLKRWMELQRRAKKDMIKPLKKEVTSEQNEGDDKPTTKRKDHTDECKEIAMKDILLQDEDAGSKKLPDVNVMSKKRSSKKKNSRSKVQPNVSTEDASKDVVKLSNATVGDNKTIAESYCNAEEAENKANVVENELVKIDGNISAAKLSVLKRASDIADGDNTRNSRSCQRRSCTQKVHYAEPTDSDNSNDEPIERPSNTKLKTPKCCNVTTTVRKVAKSRRIAW